MSRKCVGVRQLVGQIRITDTVIIDGVMFLFGVVVSSLGVFQIWGLKGSRR